MAKLSLRDCLVFLYCTFVCCICLCYMFAPSVLLSHLQETVDKSHRINSTIK